MTRALQLLIAFTVAGVVLAAAGNAQARRPVTLAACEPGEDGLLSLSAAFLRSPAPAELLLPADEAPLPLDGRLCVPGTADDAGCHPYEPFSAPGRSAAPIFSESVVLFRQPTLPPAGARRAPAVQAASERLAAGFSRRIERPPRPV